MGDMYKKFSPEEMKEAEEGQSLDAFLKARGYVAIRRTDIGKAFINIVNGVPESKSEEELQALMKKYPPEFLLITAVLIDIEKRLFKDCPEEE